MSAATARAKARIEAPPKEAATEIDPLCFADTSDIPPPVPHLVPTREQFERSLRVSLAQASAGMGEDFEVVQARMRAKYGPR
ncbi:MAG: hypothetical protein JNM40_22720 [Myxococcales bacterium]|nr:hypothetical protein [Myxococcales bacterium]